MVAGLWRKVQEQNQECPVLAQPVENACQSESRACSSLASLFFSRQWDFPPFGSEQTYTWFSRSLGLLWRGTSLMAKDCHLAAGAVTDCLWKDSSGCINCLLGSPGLGVPVRTTTMFSISCLLSTLWVQPWRATRHLVKTFYKPAPVQLSPAAVLPDRAQCRAVGRPSPCEVGEWRGWVGFHPKSDSWFIKITAVTLISNFKNRCDIL